MLVTLRRALLLSAALLLTPVAIAAAQAPAARSAPPVTVTDDGPTYTLSNGYLTIKVDKKTADLVSVKTGHTTTPNVELMGYLSGHHAGYWEQSPSLAPRREAKVTIDPATNSGARAEVSVKGYSDGISILGPHPTAAGQEGGLIADLEIRYTLERGAHGLYTYAIYTHQNTYPAGSVGESRFGFKLSGSVFDWLSIDDQRNALMPTGKRLGRRHRSQHEGGPPAHSPALSHVRPRRAQVRLLRRSVQNPRLRLGPPLSEHVGPLTLINPSLRISLLRPAPLRTHRPHRRRRWWRSHSSSTIGAVRTTGSSVLNFAANEPWTKVVGPIFVFDVPTGADSQNTLLAAEGPGSKSPI